MVDIVSTTNFLAAVANQESRFAEFTNLRHCDITVTDLFALTKRLSGASL